MSHDLTESSVLVYLIALSRLRCQNCPSTCRDGRVSHSLTAEGHRAHCSASETAATRHWASFEVWSWRLGRDLSHFVSPDGKTVPEGLMGVLVCFFWGGCFLLWGGFLDRNISCLLCKNVFYDHFALQISPSLDITQSNVTPSICGADTSRFLYLRTCLCLSSTCSCSSAKTHLFTSCQT